jgi:hypothetical protein
MEGPRLFSTYVDELKLIGLSRFTAKVASPVFLVRALDVADEEDEGPGFDTKVTHRDDVGRAVARKSDRPPGPRIGPGYVLPVVKRQDGAFRERIGIGRASNVDVRLPFGEVSKYHAYVTHDGAQWTVTDATSSNGTFVRGAFVEPRVPTVLHDADDVGFGSCRLRFYTAEGFVRFVAGRAR